MTDLFQFSIRLRRSLLLLVAIFSHIFLSIPALETSELTDGLEQMTLRQDLQETFCHYSICGVFVKKVLEENLTVSELNIHGDIG
ncbi:hypothetical protein SH449x_003091 [Pirellulaceae bacterium SH449]